MRVVHYYAQALSHFSGVTAAIDLWAQEQVRRGWTVSVAGAPGPLDPSRSYCVPFSVVEHRGTNRRSFRPRIASFRDAVSGADLVVLHEGWTLSHHLAAAACRRSGTPYAVMPHGVYDPNIVRQLRGRKLLGRLRTAAEAYWVERSEFVHLFFNSEIPDLQVVAPRSTALVAPSGALSRRLDVVGGGRPEVLWFGRFDVHHKGLDLLLQGLAGLEPDRRPALHIAGYDHLGGEAELRSLVSSLRLHESVRVTGALDEEGKRRALASTTAFVLPSRWECHSVALLEALSSGCRVLVSSAAHIGDLLRGVEGVALVAPEAQAWTAALAHLKDLPPSRHERDALWDQLSWSSSMDLLASRCSKLGSGETERVSRR
ncbi:hypothetical protein GCM10027596_22170 [Nocardioides korecus]